MREMNARLAADPELAAGYRAAHEGYLARREAPGHVPEIAGVSAGGMPYPGGVPARPPGAPAAPGPGVNPIGDETLALVGAGPCAVDRRAMAWRWRPSSATGSAEGRSGRRRRRWCPEGSERGRVRRRLVLGQLDRRPSHPLINVPENDARMPASVTHTEKSLGASVVPSVLAASSPVTVAHSESWSANVFSLWRPGRWARTRRGDQTQGDLGRDEPGTRGAGDQARVRGATAAA